ncbi:MAG TPA: ATP-binding cassette domain-containing protein [Gemmatimonadales bacterium]|jgi:simple sugar transport system ATP-binding protein
MNLALRHISKRFGGTTALDDVSLAVRGGEIHALLGENGAGKTTLVRIAYGALRADSGTLAIDDGNGPSFTTAGFPSPRDARAAGVGMVHQHFTSIDALSVAENIALTGGWHETQRAAERRAAALIATIGLPLPERVRADTLSVQMRQRLEIVKALAGDARVLLLDEPTAVLAPREVGEFLRFLRQLAARGTAIVLITHKLDEVFEVADRVSVLRRGTMVLSGEIGSQTPRSLATAMIGGDLPPPAATAAIEGPIAVQAAALRLRRPRSATVWGSDAVSFQIREGEVVGVAAIEGNGQRELLRAIAGVDRSTIVTGKLEVRGPIAFIPEDRNIEGLIPDFTLAENYLLGTLDMSPEWIHWSAVRAGANAVVTAFDVRGGGADVQAAALSGGNQQRFMMGRALARRPRVLVAEDPTRGLDLGAAHAIHARLRDAAVHGAAVIVHSSDVDEVLLLAHRILVVARGEVCEFPSGTSRAVIGDAMLALDRVA